MSTRWRIRGHLETCSLLHIGSGEVCFRKEVDNESTEPEGQDGVRTAAEIAAIARDHGGRPYLPATAIRGAVRGCAERFGSDRTRVGSLFGDAELAGGRVRFSDAFLSEIVTPATPPPFWDGGQGTGVVAQVAIDRRTRAASAQRLFHLEVVPPEQRFELEVLIEGELDDVALILSGLERFTEKGPASLGASTSNGWGRLRWTPDGEGHRGVSRLGDSEVRAWLESGAADMIDTAFAPLPAELTSMLATAKAAFDSTRVSAPGQLSLSLALAFEGPFLVKDTDPAHCGKGEDRPDGVPRRNHAGRVSLPASSLRGALRGQAERILRTVGGLGAACGPGAPRPPCPPARTLDEVATLCPACQLFGAAGWRTPVRLTDCNDTANVATPIQEFVAIDRFTGGGARRKKFNLRAAIQPTLEGELTLDLEALAAAGVGPWSLGLLALTLRDLAEGDITLGAGAARGHGRATAAIRLRSANDGTLPKTASNENATEVSEVPSPMHQILADAEQRLRLFPRLDLDTDAAYRDDMASWIEDLGVMARGANQAWEAQMQAHAKEQA